MRAMGEWIAIQGIQYRVIGIFEDVGGLGEMQKVYIPISTAQAAYGGGHFVHQIIYTLHGTDLASSQAMAEQTRELLAKRHHFSPDDPRALRLRNNVERYQEIVEIFAMIRLFIWVVGVGTLLAGIVGVSNIMLVSVQERTKEIGLRKALGATPGSIVAMILQEAVLLTSVAGYAGLVVGVGFIELVNRYLPENDYVRSPEVDIGVVLTATVLLVIFGALAGFFPASRAASIHPIDALRDG